MIENCPIIPDSPLFVRFLDELWQTHYSFSLQMYQRKPMIQHFIEYNKSGLNHARECESLDKNVEAIYKKKGKKNNP